MGELHHFRGVKVVQSQSTGEVWIGQGAYTKSILQKFGMEDANAVSTPVDPSVKLEKDEDVSPWTKECTSRPLGASSISLPGHHLCSR